MTALRTVAIVLFSALAVAGCRQADGPAPQADANVEEELKDVGRDLQNVARRDPAGPADLEHDLTKYARNHEEVPAVAELSRRTSTVIADRTLDDQIATRLAHSLWTAVAGREFSERQVESLQKDMQSILVAAGVAEPQAQQVAAQVGEVQKQVTQRPRRWYELF